MKVFTTVWMKDESRVMSFGVRTPREIIFGVNIVNGRVCEGNFCWGRRLELVIAGTCEGKVELPCF